MEWLYGVLKQLRSCIETECTRPRVLNVNELAFPQPGAEHDLVGSALRDARQGRDPANQPKVCGTVVSV